jgi:EF hand domain-containing protein
MPLGQGYIDEPRLEALVLAREVDMRKHVLALTTSTLILACGAISGNVQAQAPGTQNPEQQSPSNQGGYGNRGEMMGPMMRGGMMGRGMMGHGMMVQGRRGAVPGTMGPLMMRMMFALMDADGDGKISLQEFQVAHERIFKAMDANKDGFVTLQEMQEFIRGTGTPTPSSSLARGLNCLS